MYTFCFINLSKFFVNFKRNLIVSTIIQLNWKSTLIYPILAYNIIKIVKTKKSNKKLTFLVGKHTCVFVVLGCQTSGRTRKDIRRGDTIGSGVYTYNSWTFAKRNVLTRLYIRSSQVAVLLIFSIDLQTIK